MPVVAVFAGGFFWTRPPRHAAFWTRPPRHAAFWTLLIGIPVGGAIFLGGEISCGI